MRKTSFLLLLPLLICTVSPSFGQKVVGGLVTDTLWTVADNPVIVVGNVTIPAGTTLTIGSGVVIQFAANATITVNGGVRVLGTAASPVMVGGTTGSASGGAWKGFRVQSGASFEVRNAIFSRADVAIDLRPSIQPVAITNTVFDNNNTALYAERPVIFLANSLTNNGKGIVFDGFVPKDSVRGNRFCNTAVNVLNKRSGAVNLADNCWCTGDSATIAASLQKLNTSSGNLIFIPFDSTCINGMVFPGDANYDQVVDMTDLFSIGYGYGWTGPARNYPTVEWIGQPAAPWADTLANDLNAKHADCDGDGVIDSMDTYPILHNFQYTHTAQRLQQTDSLPSLVFSVNPLPYNSGATIEIPLFLGANQPLMNFYGISFTVVFDTAMVEMGTALEPVRVRFDTCWIGTPSVDYIHLQKGVTPGNRVAGLTRIDRQSVVGGGRIADIIVVLSDQVGKMGKTVTYPISITDVVAVDEYLQPIAIAGGTSTIQVSNSSRTERDQEVADIQLSPNPARESVRVTSSVPGQAVILTDLAGRTVLTQPMEGLTTTVALAGIPAGMYLLQVETLTGICTRMLTIR